VHKTANVLNKLPKSQQPKAKRALQDIWMAATRKDAAKAFDAFLATYVLKFEKAAACLDKDRQALLAFTTSLTSIGSTCAPRTRSRARSPRCATGLSAPRAVSRKRRRWP